jgi:hypothetical protein
LSLPPFKTAVGTRYSTHSAAIVATVGENGGGSIVFDNLYNGHQFFENHEKII